MHSIRALTVHVRRPVKIHNNKEISNKTWEDSSGSFRVNTGFYNSFHPCYYDNALNMKGKRSWKSDDWDFLCFAHYMHHNGKIYIICSSGRSDHFQPVWKKTGI